jgi:hypothetical protein
MRIYPIFRVRRLSHHFESFLRFTVRRKLLATVGNVDDRTPIMYRWAPILHYPEAGLIEGQLAANQPIELFVDGERERRVRRIPPGVLLSGYATWRAMCAFCRFMVQIASLGSSATQTWSFTGPWLRLLLLHLCPIFVSLDDRLASDDYGGSHRSR